MRSIKILLLPILLSLVSSDIQAQYLLKNKMQLDLDYGFAKGINASDPNLDGTILPSVLGYMKQGRDISLSFSYLFKNITGIHLKVSDNFFDHWDGPEYSNLYESTEMNIISIKPGVFFTSKFKKTGAFNRLSFKIVAGPAIEYTTFRPGENFMWFQQHTYNEPFREITDNAAGVFTGLSVHYAVGQLIGFNLFYELEKYWGVNSLISGNGMCLQSFGAGISFRFLIDKYYLYE